LAESGFTVGRNVAIEYRFSEGQDERLPALAAELVRRHVTLLVATDRPLAVAAKAATERIPIVFTSGFDPVQIGLVASFNRPGGNATGVSLLTVVLGPKRLGLLRELLPKPGTIAFVVNPNSALTPFQVQEMQGAAQAVGQPLLVVSVGTEDDVDKAFADMAERNVAAILYAANPLFQVIRERLVALAARYRIPALYEWREFVTAGGLMSYSTDRNEVGREAGNYAGRILKGENPAELPVVQSSRFEFVINLKTAKALGLEIPPTLLARADEVIE
jgi:putative ABC transport system substrate-binding protein